MKDNSKISDSISMDMGKGFHDDFAPGCNIRIQVFGPDGKLKDERQTHNTVTTAGLAGLMDQVLASPSLTKMGWMAIGTGTPASTSCASAGGADRSGLRPRAGG